jgi:hypothetical protein
MSSARATPENLSTFSNLVKGLFPTGIEFNTTLSDNTTITLNYVSADIVTNNAIYDALNVRFRQYMQSSSEQSTDSDLPISVIFKEQDLNTLTQFIKDNQDSLKEKISREFDAAFKKHESYFWYKKSLGFLKEKLRENENVAAVYVGLKQFVTKKFNDINLAVEKPDTVRELAQAIYKGLEADIKSAIAENETSKLLYETSSQTVPTTAPKKKKSLTFDLLKSLESTVERVDDIEEKYESVYQRKSNQFIKKETKFVESVANGTPLNYEQEYKHLIHLAERAAKLAPNEDGARWRSTISKYQMLLKQEFPNLVPSSSQQKKI